MILKNMNVSHTGLVDIESFMALYGVDEYMLVVVDFLSAFSKYSEVDRTNVIINQTLVEALVSNNICLNNRYAFEVSALMVDNGLYSMSGFDEKYICAIAAEYGLDRITYVTDILFHHNTFDHCVLGWVTDTMATVAVGKT